MNGPAAAPLRVILADDQALFREGLRTLLSRAEGIRVVAEAKDGHEAVAQCRQHEPDVVLMDLRMPGLDGVAATAAVRKLRPAPQVLVLTTFDHDAEVFRALTAGAIGYLLKDVSSAVFFEGIRRAARGESVLEPTVASKVVREFARLQETRQRRVEQPLVEPLSARELHVLEHLAAGRSNKEIASQLNIAEGTVKNHMSQVLAKLGVLDRTQAALRARELGLV
jgi:DNA-binding NarL/FixJ family response regulator